MSEDCGAEDIERVLRNLQQHLSSVAKHWFMIGVLLGLKVSDLERIIDDDDIVCLRSMINEWLNNTMEPKLLNIIEAIAHPAGGSNFTLASEFSAKYHSVS